MEEDESVADSGFLGHGSGGEPPEAVAGGHAVGGGQHLLSALVFGDFGTGHGTFSRRVLTRRSM